MSFKDLATSVPKLCLEIEALAAQHQEKGLVHLTYGLVPAFKKYLTDPRFIWHTQANKLDVYEKFRKSEGNEILMACGLAEGIDLVGEEYKWQVIAKIMFPSLQDSLVVRMKEAEPRWYAWQTIKSVVQQSGRICRTPTDYGITYILDSNFTFLYQRETSLFPKYFREAVRWKKKET
jgi:Rad3-related DNA helicase